MYWLKKKEKEWAWSSCSYVIPVCAAFSLEQMITAVCSLQPIESWAYSSSWTGPAPLSLFFFFTALNNTICILCLKAATLGKKQGKTLYCYALLVVGSLQFWILWLKIGFGFHFTRSILPAVSFGAPMAAGLRDCPCCDCNWYGIELERSDKKVSWKYKFRER